MRRCLLILPVLALLAGCAAPGAQPPPPPEPSYFLQDGVEVATAHEDALLQKLGTAWRESLQLGDDVPYGFAVCQILYDVFDPDAGYGMFAVGGYNRNEIWYVSDTVAERVSGSWLNIAGYVVELDGRRFAVFAEDTMQQYPWHHSIYGVQAGRPEAHTLGGHSNQGILWVDEWGDLVRDSFSTDVIGCHADGSVDMSIGITQYYYFFADGRFREYGGLEITPEDLLGLDGARELLEQRAPGCEPVQVYYRGNGVVVVNYLTGPAAGGYVSLGHVALRLREDGTLQYEVMPARGIDWDLFGRGINRPEYQGSGHALRALTPETASYPASFAAP